MVKTLFHKRLFWDFLKEGRKHIFEGKSNMEKDVDTVFCPPLTYMSDPKKSKNVIFSSWGCENIQNDVAQPIRTPKHPKCLFQLK